MFDGFYSIFVLVGQFPTFNLGLAHYMVLGPSLLFVCAQVNNNAHNVNYIVYMLQLYMNIEYHYNYIKPKIYIC